MLCSLRNFWHDAIFFAKLRIFFGAKRFSFLRKIGPAVHCNLFLQHLIPALKKGFPFPSGLEIQVVCIFNIFFKHDKKTAENSAVTYYLLPKSYDLFNKSFVFQQRFQIRISSGEVFKCRIQIH